MFDHTSIYGTVVLALVSPQHAHHSKVGETDQPASRVSRSIALFRIVPLLLQDRRRRFDRRADQLLPVVECFGVSFSKFIQLLISSLVKAIKKVSKVGLAVKQQTPKKRNNLRLRDSVFFMFCVMVLK